MAERDARGRFAKTQEANLTETIWVDCDPPKSSAPIWGIIAALLLLVGALYLATH